MLKYDTKIYINYYDYNFSVMPQKIIIAGSRNITEYDIVDDAINKALSKKFMENNFEIISGGARGVDTLAIEYAQNNDIKYYVIKPKYRSYNDKSAPIRRNTEMAEVGDALIAIWDGHSKGTKNMIEQMQKLNKPVFKFEFTS